jgi:tripartite-type tricarboxylate transporter receptor subunit TctC
MRKLGAFVIIALGFGLATSQAQDYPSRPVTMVVPYPAGGPTDTIARIIADRINVPLHQPLVIENISGAGGSIGVGRVAHSVPDGYTLSIGHVQTHVLNAATMKLDYDVINDFAPVSLITDTPIWIISKKSLPADDLNGLIAWLKAQDGKATAGTVGVGGPTEIIGLIFQKQTGTRFQTVPYRGGAPLLQDLLGEHIDFAFGQASTYLSYVRNGDLKAYAVVGSKRWWAAPEVLTLDELGIHNVSGSFWHGIWGAEGDTGHSDL